MASPFSIHQQQLAILAQQRSLLMAAAAKSSGGGGASIFQGKTDKSGSNDSQLCSGNLSVQNWPNTGFQIPGMMMPGGQNNLQNYVQAWCYKSLPPVLLLKILLIG